MAKEVKVSIIVDDNGTMRLTEKSAKKLGAGLEKAGKSAQTADRQLKGVAQASSGAGKNFSKQAQGISGGIVPAYAALAAQVFAVGAAFRFLKDAGNLVTLETGQQAYASSTGIALKTLTKNIIDATDAQVTFTDAAQAAAIGTAAGLTTSQLEGLGKAAKDVSIVLGRDVTDSFNRLVRGVTKAEPELLDELGIILRLKDATQTYADSIGKNVNDLNAFQRSQAVANDVLTQTEEKYSKILAISDPQANQFNQFGKSFDDLVNTIKKGINFLAAPLAGFLAMNPFASLLLAAPLLKGFLNLIIPQISEFSTGAIQGLDGIGDSVKELQRNLKVDAIELGALKGDTETAKLLLDDAGKSAVKLGEKYKIPFIGLQKLKNEGNIAGRTLKTAIKQATEGTGKFAGQTLEVRRKFINAFKDMEIAQTILAGKSAVAAKQVSNFWVSAYARIKLAAVSFASTAISWTYKLVKFTGAAISRFLPFIGALTLAFEFIPDSVKRFINSFLGIRSVEKDVKKLLEKVESLNDEYTAFAKTQRALGSDLDDNYSVSLKTLSAVGQLVKSLSITDEKDLLKNYNEELKFLATSTANVAAVADKAQKALNEAFGSEYFDTGAADNKNIDTLKEYIKQRLESITVTELQGDSVERYREQLELVNNTLDRGTELSGKQIKDLLRARTNFEELTSEVDSYKKSLEDLGPRMTKTLNDLVPSNPLKDLIDDFDTIETAIFSINKGQQNFVALTKKGEELLLNIGVQERKILLNELIKNDLIERRLELEQRIAMDKIIREKQFIAASLYSSKRQLIQQKSVQTQLNLEDDILRKKQSISLILDNIAAKGEKLTKGQIDTLSLEQAQIELLEKQLETIKKQEESAYKLGMALKNGLETGLETNIYDLLIGDETSFKDAILKSASTAAKTAAKELAGQITDSIMGSVFGKKETEEEKRNRKLLETFQSGGEDVKQKIIEAFSQAQSNFAAFEKDPNSGTFGTTKLQEETALVKKVENIDGLNSTKVLETATKSSVSLKSSDRGNTVDNPVYVHVVNFPVAMGGGMGVNADGPNSIAAKGSLGSVIGGMGVNSKPEKKYTRDNGEEIVQEWSSDVSASVASIENLNRIQAERTEEAMSTSLESSKELSKGAFSLNNLPSLLMSVLGGGGFNVGDIIGGIFGAAAGGIMPGGVTGYANGGIVKRPTVGLVGEGKMNEAVVPLPDGKAIPVNMGSGMVQNNNVTVNVSMDGQGNSQSESNSDGQMGANMGKLIAGAVQDELQRQKRPGGILSPYGAA